MFGVINGTENASSKDAKKLELVWFSMPRTGAMTNETTWLAVRISKAWEAHEELGELWGPVMRWNNGSCSVYVFLWEMQALFTLSNNYSGSLWRVGLILGVGGRGVLWVIVLWANCMWPQVGNRVLHMLGKMRRWLGVSYMHLQENPHPCWVKAFQVQPVVGRRAHIWVGTLHLCFVRKSINSFVLQSEHYMEYGHCLLLEPQEEGSLLRTPPEKEA